MTRREMEQALLIDSDHRAAPSVVANVDFPRMCGPIVEVVDDSPQFVHFTVKEYARLRHACNCFELLTEPQIYFQSGYLRLYQQI